MGGPFDRARPAGRVRGRLASLDRECGEGGRHFPVAMVALAGRWRTGRGLARAARNRASRSRLSGPWGVPGWWCAGNALNQVQRRLAWGVTGEEEGVAQPGGRCQDAADRRAVPFVLAVWRRVFSASGQPAALIWIAAGVVVGVTVIGSGWRNRAAATSAGSDNAPLNRPERHRGALPALLAGNAPLPPATQIVWGVPSAPRR
jgi:hypothetical protein